MDDISDPDTRRLTEARVDPDQECARGWGIDLGGVARLWPWILVGSAAAILTLLLGVLGMLWVGRAVTRRVRRSSGPPVI